MKPYEYYEGKHLEYPKKTSEYPTRPSSKATSTEYTEYAKKLKAYEDSKPEYERLMSEYRKAKRELEAEFKNDLFNEYGVTDHPKADKCFSLAYEHGHSSGFSDVVNYFDDFVQLIKD